MAEDGEAKGSYEVGHKRPPKNSQWKRGQSGNPSGRPKGSVSLQAKVQKALRRTVNVTLNGRPVRMSRTDVMAERLADSAVKCDPKLLPLVMRLLGDDGPAIQAQGAATDAPAFDAAALKRMQQRLQHMTEDFE